jgi:hypothetical protein
MERTEEDKLGTNSQEEDNDFNEKVKEAREDKDKACDLYIGYVGKAETFEEIKRRINNFRSGG